MTFFFISILFIGMISNTYGSHSIGNAWGAFLTTTLHICSQWFHASTKKNWPQKHPSWRLRHQRGQPEKTYSCQLPEFWNSTPKKKEQLLKKVILGSPCTREILSVSVQSASVLACSEPRSTKTAAADNSKGNWLRYLLFRSRLQQNQIAESFRNPNRIKGLPGMPSCRIQAWSTIIQVYLDLSPQVTIVVTTWDY